MQFKVTVLPGDGIGPEVTAEAVRVLQTRSTAAPCLRSKSLWKILTPATINQFSNIRANNKLSWKTRLGARIDHDRRFVDEMVSLHGGLRGVNIGRGLETRPRGPQKGRG
jgi:hypothetical protein